MLALKKLRSLSEYRTFGRTTVAAGFAAAAGTLLDKRVPAVESTAGTADDCPVVFLVVFVVTFLLCAVVVEAGLSLVVSLVVEAVEDGFTEDEDTVEGFRMEALSGP